jgi:hypothetical protein
MMCATKVLFHSTAQLWNGLMLFRTDKIVNALASDLDLDVLDQTQTEVVDIGVEVRHGGLEVNTVDQITVTGDLASDTLAKSSRAVDINTLSFDIFESDLSLITRD